MRSLDPQDLPLSTCCVRTAI